MSDETSGGAAKAPWHFWLISVVAVLWNAMGALDYFMTKTRNEGYMSQFTPEQLEFFYSFPAWVVATWAIAVWGALFASILLLLRRSLAVQVFLASFICMLITMFHNYGLSNGFDVVGDTFSLVFTGVIFVIALFLFLYARGMDNKGVLR